MNPSRLVFSFISLAVILALGTVGYVLAEHMSVFEAFYMSIITISTVGFSEIKPLSQTGRLITVVLIVTGISLLTYTLGQVVNIFIEGELQRIFGRRKLEKQIRELKNHFIICGYGRIGSVISMELHSEAIPFVVIEQSQPKIEKLEKDQFFYIAMDATTDDALVKAGIGRARGIVTAVSSDADNVFITLTAKGLRPDIFVLARTSEEQNREKLIRAGASRVVCPYQIGGRRMAQVLKRPTVADFIDSATLNEGLDLLLEEVVVGQSSNLAGKNLIDGRIRKDFGVIIVAIKKPSSAMIFNPLPEKTLKTGDTLVVIGKKNDLKRLKQALNPSPDALRPK
jgi:voltage-gated potassium channel